MYINFLELSWGCLDFESADLRLTDAAEFSERQSASVAVSRETAETWSDAIQEGLGAGVEIEQRVSGSSWWLGEGLPGIGTLRLIKKVRSRGCGAVWRVFEPWWCPLIHPGVASGGF